MSFFLTGSDTSVGKTFVVVQLLRWLRSKGVRAAGFKPICCGDRNDAHQLLAASSDDLEIDQVNPIWLKSTVAPSVAADIEKIDIEPHQILAAFEHLRRRFETVLVEGAGGWRVPIAHNFFVSDLARSFDLPVAVVAENRLGVLNHVLLTVESIERCGLECAGVFLNHACASTDVARSTNQRELQRLLGQRLLIAVADEISDESAAELLPFLEKTEGADVFKKLTQMFVP